MKTKRAKILNSRKEKHVDAIGVKEKENWQVKTLGAESETKLEDDKGEGGLVKLFFFDYAANPVAFKKELPTAQELFNAHVKEIEIKLWEQGWTVYTDVAPRLMLSKKKTHYRFIIPAIPSRGRIVREQPKTLSEIAHEGSRDSNKVRGVV